MFCFRKALYKEYEAAKASNLIFAGTKTLKPSSEASVEMVLDNSDKSFFSVQDKEVSIKRIVRRNGQGIYRINNQTKTRQEVLELLAQAGIDPHGFNIVLQGEIDNFVKVHSEDRRKIIEEVAGISVYETRKQKSLKELEKTEERLKEVNAILRERTSYLKNLENERQQALKFKKLEETVMRCKASIFKRRLDEKTKEKENTEEEIDKRNKQADKIRIDIGKINEEIESKNKKIEEINSQIQKSSGVEQESIGNEIAELKAEIAGLNVRRDNYQSQIDEIDRRKEELEKNIKGFENEIKEMRKTEGKSRKSDLENKEKELLEIEKQIKEYYSFKSSLNLLAERLDDKKQAIQRVQSESESVLKRIEEIEFSLKFKQNPEENKKILESLKIRLQETKNKKEESERIILNSEKQIAAFEGQIQELEKIKTQIGKIDICPLCKTKITSSHKNHIEEEANGKISKLNSLLKELEQKKTKAYENKEESILNTKNFENEIEEREKQIGKVDNINEKKSDLKRLSEQKKEIEKEIGEVKEKRQSLEKKVTNFKNLEEGYERLKLEVEELKRHEEADVGMEVVLKQRELDRMKLIIKQITRQKEELEQDTQEIEQDLEEKNKEAEKKEEKEEEIQNKFKKMFEEKNSLQDKIKVLETDLMKEQNSLRIVEGEINNQKIKIAEVNAQIEGIEVDYEEFKNEEIIKIPLEQLKERLEKTQQILNTIGSVNMRALEVYDHIKKEYDAIAEKVTQLGKEKEEILKIVKEIDNKKKKTFRKTLDEINALFTRNFSQLSTKGEAFLEIENKEDIFVGGLAITIKVGKGKFFDVHSLSGGEQTLIALALIFAIQKYKPYCFYIFDEIDAALDKRNSERLAALLKQHMKAGQYIIITHNDAIITESTTLYGISMQEGISKILSLEI